MCVRLWVQFPALKYKVLENQFEDIKIKQFYPTSIVSFVCSELLPGLL